ncbi:MAG: triose-phosphate isomerase [Candidatus Nomurabacteria bacterium]
MSKLKLPIIISNWKSNPKNLLEAKTILQKLDKEFTSLQKKEKKKKSIDLLLAVPSPFIYPIQSFLKEKRNSKLKNILIGAQNFDNTERSDINNSISLTQLKSVGTQFVILNDADIMSENENLKNISEKKEDRNPNKFEANRILLERINGVSTKTEEIKQENKPKDPIKSNPLIMKKLERLEEKIRATLENGVIAIFFIKEDNLENFKNISEIIKKTIKNIHYNLFDKLIICYEPSREFFKVEQTDMEDCIEKTIAIRRSIANMFGIDSAKKVKILYSGKINENNVKEILKNGGVDGIFINEESISPEVLAKVIYTAK